MNFYVVPGAFAVLAVLMSLYAALLIVLRSRLYHRPVYRPMLWNIFLAWVPVLIVGLGLVAVLAVAEYPVAQVTLLFVVLLLWLLTFPNAPYLITELNSSHRQADDAVPLHFDIVHTLTLTSAGLFVGQLSLLIVHFTLVVILSPGYWAVGILMVPPVSWTIIAVCIALGTFAIYLGRNVRVNSWDILQPWNFLRRLIRHLRNPRERSAAFGYTIFYGTFIAIMHAVFFGMAQILMS